MDVDCSEFFCPHPDCPDRGLRGKGNIRPKEQYGQNETWLLWCRTCHRTFSERRDTPLFGSKLPEEKFVAVLRHLCDGGGIRETARTVGVARRTVERMVQLAGEHAREFNREKLRDLGLSQVQVDELYTYVKKRPGTRRGAAKR